MAHHVLLLNFVAAVSYGAQQGRCYVDTAVRLKPSTLEQAVFVVAMVGCAAVFVVLSQTHLHVRSISVDMQYFVCAVVAMLICSFVPSRATLLLKVIAATAVVTSVAFSIQTASELINAPAGLQLQVPMPVIGIDWMQAFFQVASLSSFVVVIHAQEGAMNPAVNLFYSSLYLRRVAAAACQHCVP
jgi:hypothetical protein